MRVAMGLALNGTTAKPAPSSSTTCCPASTSCRATPTLFNPARRSQLSSCYLTTVVDDLDGIYEAHQGKRAAVQVRRRPGQRLDQRARPGRRIKGTNGKSQGVVPFLKVVNDTAVAVNQGGKRKGAVCAYLEPGTWTSKSSSSCARTPATTAAAPTT